MTSNTKLLHLTKCCVRPTRGGTSGMGCAWGQSAFFEQNNQLGKPQDKN